MAAVVCIMLYDVLLCQLLFYYIILHYIRSFHSISYYMLPCNIISYHTISYLIILNDVTYVKRMKKMK